MRAQNSSGCSCASRRRLSNSAIDLRCASCENCAGGGNTRSSWDSDSILVLTGDIDSGDDSSGKVCGAIDYTSVYVCRSVYHKGARPTMRASLSLVKRDMRGIIQPALEGAAEGSHGQALGNPRCFFLSGIAPRLDPVNKLTFPKRAQRTCRWRC